MWLMRISLVVTEKIIRFDRDWFSKGTSRKRRKRIYIFFFPFLNYRLTTLDSREK